MQTDFPTWPDMYPLLDISFYQTTERYGKSLNFSSLIQRVSKPTTNSKAVFKTQILKHSFHKSNIEDSQPLLLIVS
jgi:hypothetical protein